MHHKRACAEQPRRDGRLLGVEDARGLAVREPGDVARDKRETVALGETGDRREDLPRLQRLLGALAAAGIDGLDLVDRGRADKGTSRGGAPGGEEGVAQHRHQVGELVLAAQQPRTGEHPRERLLDEVFRLVGRTAQSPRGAVEPVEMARQRLGIERGHRARL